ncbi:mechanosensitive ion channel family protein [Acuticoccus kandeliae]|uniref:mechanosensitive ion channel family protein n=1 Tax=Acuticoccus kandeliae TaxID=2073160 RepID=UPI001B3BB654|nr:mechanosensitive ion channel family protein [Acuticoccus kandeliae]
MILQMRNLPVSVWLVLSLLFATLCFAAGANAQDGAAGSSPAPAPAAAEAPAADGEAAPGTVSEETARQAEQSADQLDQAVRAAGAAEAGAANADGASEGQSQAAVENAAEAVAEAAVDENARDSATGLAVEVLDPKISTDELELRLVPLTKAELEKLAQVWLEIVRKKTEEVMAAQVAIMRTEGAVADAARENLTELVAERKGLFDKYSKVISSWEKKGGDAAAIAELRAYRSSIIIEETRTADFKTLLAQMMAWLTARDGGVQLAIDIGIIVASLAGLVLAARVVRRLARRWIGHVPHLSKLLQIFLVGLIYWFVLAIGLMVVLSGLGIDISPVFALIGGASFIIAFALQDTLGNLASGLMIMVNRPFDEGDYVDVGGVAGTVRTVTIVSTTVVTPDNQIIVIPNKNVWGNVITNVTASTTRRVDLIFGVSYEDDLRKAMHVIETTVKAHPLVLPEPEPVIRVHELADSSVNFVCRPWTRTSDYWTVYWDLTQQIKEQFDAADISIPYPQQDVHLRRPAEPAAAASAPLARPEMEMSGQSKGFARNDEGFDGDERGD